MQKLLHDGSELLKIKPFLWPSSFPSCDRAKLQWLSILIEAGWGPAQPYGLTIDRMFAGGGTGKTAIPYIEGLKVDLKIRPTNIYYHFNQISLKPFGGIQPVCFHCVVRDILIESTKLIDWLLSLCDAAEHEFKQLSEEMKPVNTDDEGVKKVAESRPKKSATNGDARSKLIAALTVHHKYADDSCMNFSPIGNNALARLAEVSNSTASEFLKKQFGGLNDYKKACGTSKTLISSLKLLNQEFAPRNILSLKNDSVAAEESDLDGE